jgi:rSAM/selenodomain-associated transferase 2
LVSIIVPVYNEEKNIEGIIRTLESLEGEKEIIVVDGESLDNTFEQASKLSNTIRVKKGRANQMNQGAAAAQGDILWFVHADSKLQKDSIRHIEDAVSEGNVGGGFSIYFYDYNTKFMRYISSTSNRRSILTGLFYGDQGIFVKRKTFFEVGGFPDMELMEDFKFSGIIRKAGKMKLLEKSIGTSARRYKNGGQLRTHLMMHRIRIMYLLGVSPRRLNKIYGESR